MAQKIDLYHRTDASTWKGDGPFDLTVVYEDTTTRNRAAALYDSLVQRLADECEFHSTWWQFDELSNHALSEQAAEAACRASMVILSFRSATTLPKTVQEWLTTWLPQKKQDTSALVTLIAGTELGSGTICPIQRKLEEMAHASNMDFFVQNFDGPSLSLMNHRSGKMVSETEIQPRSEKAPLDGVPPQSHWGINE